MVRVSHPHNLAFLGPRAHLEAFRQCLSVDDERMVPGCLKGVGQAAENGLTIMKNGRGLAMHDSLGPHHCRSKGVSNGLMAQADPHDGNGLVKMSDHLNRDSRFLGRTGTRGEEDGRWFQLSDVFQTKGIIPLDHSPPPQVRAIECTRL